MAADIDAVDDVLAALADPMRRRVLDRLAAHGETTATVLGAELPVSRQAVVQHLAVLERVLLVASHRAGRERRYTVQPEQLTATAAWMTRIAAQWDARLAAIRVLAEASSQTQDVPPQPTDEHPPREDTHPRMSADGHPLRLSRTPAVVTNRLRCSSPTARW